MIYPIQQKKSGILYREIDNPGRGNCGFYAFAIGLIQVIQNEIAKGNTNPIQLKVLNQFAEKGKKYTINDFMNFNFNQERISDRRLLEKMQSSLREMLHQNYLQNLHCNAVVIEGTNKLDTNSVNVYQFFLEMVNYYLRGKRFDKAMNFLYLSKNLRDYAREVARQIKNKGYSGASVQDAFLSDLYGKDYVKKVEIPWNQDFKNNDFSPKENELLLNFKQFNIIFYDYYYYSCSTRLTTPDFKLKAQAAACAEKMKNLHQRVIISVGNELLSQENLAQGTLYIQIVSTVPAVVRVYSSILDKAYNYSPIKANDLLWHVQHHFPKWNYKSEITLTNSKPKLMKEFASTANNTLMKEFFPKEIQNEFLRSYGLTEKEQNFGEISELLDSDCTQPLSLEVKQFHSDTAAKRLAGEVNNSSLILRALSRIKNSEWLATHADLNCLAELFGVHLKSLKNDEPSPDQKQITENRPIVTVNNLGNFHWTTQIQVAYFAGETTKKYVSLGYENLPLSKPEIKKILLSYTTGFLSFFGRRNHLKKAEELIANCDKNSVSMVDIMKDFQSYMSNKTYDPNSSFRKRFEYLNARYRSLENDSFSKKDIEKLFANYALTGYFRNHLPEAQRIIAACKSSKTDIVQIVASIEHYVRKNKSQFNQDSHFLRCYQQVLEMREAYDEGKQLRLI